MDARGKVLSKIQKPRSVRKMQRSKEILIIEFLEVALPGVKKTVLVYKTFTNFKVTNNYLELLIQNELIECSSEIYTTTEKGKNYLKLAKTLSLMLK